MATIQYALSATLGLGLLGCSAHAAVKSRSGLVAPAMPELSGLLSMPAGNPSDVRCSARPSERESVVYGRSGGGDANVRKVFRRVGEGEAVRLAVACLESDVNGDGRTDVVRHYDDNGQVRREYADRNLDGRIDMSTSYEDGKVVFRVLDEDHDGRVDSRLYYEHGKPVRAERDLSGRSTGGVWRPDRWEYFEDGRVIRMGTDLDGDGRVDRWDRDAHRGGEQASGRTGDGSTRTRIGG